MPTVFSKEIEQPADKSSSSKLSSNNKVKKNSVGNQHKFAQQTHSKKNKSLSIRGPDYIWTKYTQTIE